MLPETAEREHAAGTRKAAGRSVEILFALGGRTWARSGTQGTPAHPGRQAAIGRRGRCEVGARPPAARMAPVWMHFARYALPNEPSPQELLVSIDVNSLVIILIHSLIL